MNGIKVGDKVVVVGGRDKRGMTGTVTEIGGRVGGEPAAFVLIHGKRCSYHTFFKMSYLVAVK